MPISTSMNRWSRITTDIDTESVSSSSPFDSFNKQYADRPHQEETSKDTEKPHNLLHRVLLEPGRNGKYAHYR